MKKFLTVIVFVLCAVMLASCSANPYGPNAGEFGDLDISDVSGWLGENYQYGDVVENDFVNASAQPDSYFSMDRNTANYSIMRRQINEGLTVAPASVRLEEYVNYFNYDYARPTGDDALAISGCITDCPWNSAHKLLQIGVAAEQVDMSARKPNNIVFLIDTSGSMSFDDRLPLIQQSLVMMLDSLSDDDIVSVVTYAADAGVRLEGARVKTDKITVAHVIEDLMASGSTNGEGGINVAYSVAEKYFVEGGTNRVILATDGDFNVGATNQTALKSLIKSHANNASKPITLSVLGVGMFNTNDKTMETLANNGNGNHFYLDDINEARKVLTQEFGGTMHVVAKDVKAGVTFNSDVVSSYRLLGYDTKLLSQDEFNDDKTDAGEIGSGHTVTALYEVELRSDAIAADQAAQIAAVEVRYKTPDAAATDKSVTKSFTVADITAQPSAQTVFIGCVAEFALVLRQSDKAPQADIEQVLARLDSIADYVQADPFRAEFAELARALATQSAKGE